MMFPTRRIHLRGDPLPQDFSAPAVRYVFLARALLRLGARLALRRRVGVDALEARFRVFDRGRFFSASRASGRASETFRRGDVVPVVQEHRALRQEVPPERGVAKLEPQQRRRAPAQAMCLSVWVVVVHRYMRARVSLRLRPPG